MSHPLTRRIAQVALIVAAGATPLAAAGSAAASDLLPAGTDLGAGLTKLDAPSNQSTLQHATHNVGEVAGATGAATVATGVPAAADATGATVAMASPQADRMLGKVTSPLDRTTQATGDLATAADRTMPGIVEHLAQNAAHQRSATRGIGLPTGAAPGADLLQSLPGLTKNLPGAEALPLGALTGQANAHRLGGTPPLDNSPTDALPLGQATGGLSQLTSLLGGLGVR